ncbi:MAG: NADPH-dependent F420 reductase [Actinomycetaceae bacterium]
MPREPGRGARYSAAGSRCQGAPGPGGRPRRRNTWRRARRSAPMTRTIGIVGAGRLGTALGRLVAEAGYELLVTDRPDAPHLRLVVSSVLPEAELVDLAELAARADVVVLAVPYAAARQLDLGVFPGIVVDATNAWELTDATTAGDVDTTAELARAHPGTRVVKAFNQASYADLLADARPAGSAGRLAVGVSTADAAARSVVGGIVDRAGYDPVELDADAGHLLEPGGPVFGRKLTRDELEETVREGRAA